MDPLDVLAGHFLKGPCDDRLSQDAAQNIRIVDVLGAFFQAEHGHFFRQVGCGEQGIALFISGDGTAKIGIAVVFRLVVPMTLNGAISFSVIVAFMLYVRLFTQPLSQLAPPFRVPIARLAAAQAAIKNPR